MIYSGIDLHNTDMVITTIDSNGTGRPALIGLFLAESILISFLALLVAIELTELFLALFEQFAGLKLLETLDTGWEQVASILVKVFTHRGPWLQVF